MAGQKWRHCRLEDGCHPLVQVQELQIRKCMIVSAIDQPSLYKRSLSHEHPALFLSYHPPLPPPSHLLSTPYFPITCSPLCIHHMYSHLIRSTTTISGGARKLFDIDTPIRPLVLRILNLWRGKCESTGSASPKHRLQATGQRKVSTTSSHIQGEWLRMGCSVFFAVVTIWKKCQPLPSKREVHGITVRTFASHPQEFLTENRLPKSFYCWEICVIFQFRCLVLI